MFDPPRVTQRLQRGYASYFGSPPGLLTAILLKNEATLSIQKHAKRFFLVSYLRIQLVAFRQPPGQ